MKHNSFFASWSGGKDSCLALWKALKQGYKVSYLLNMLNETGSKSRSHGLPKDILILQSKSIGIPIVQRNTTWSNYEAEFKTVVKELKSLGVKGGIFGDIYLQEHCDWIERVCNEININVLLPLWKAPTKKLVQEFISEGFEAIIVSVKADIFEESWLGRLLDENLLEDLITIGVDPCGEAGEYHTLVIDGPLFKKRVSFQTDGILIQNGYRLLKFVC